MLDTTCIAVNEHYSFWSIVIFIGPFAIFHQTMLTNLYLHQIFTESAPKPIQSVSRDVRLFVCLCICPLDVSFYWRAIETFSQRYSFLNCLNKRQKWLKMVRNGYGWKMAGNG